MTTALEKPQTPTLPEPVARRGITEAQWRTLMNSLFPGAKGESVLLVWDYCKARNLDPLKKPCHIVPMEIKVGSAYEWRDVVMPGIYELRTTAQRTGEYLGHAKPTYGEVVEHAGVTAPVSCDFTVYRWNQLAGQRAEFPVTVYFAEVVATKRDGKANARWSKAPIQMLTKCAEAAALREAFPDELGGQQTAEEMDGQRAIDVTPAPKPSPALVKPESYDDWLIDMEAVAREGEPALLKAWSASAQPCVDYLMATAPDTWDMWKATAASVARAES
jgi:phage recombination protein Bet